MEKTIIKYDELIAEGISNNKIVWVEKHDDIIGYAECFDTKQEFINSFKEGDLKYLTAEEGYITACNEEYINNLFDFAPPYWKDEEQNEELTPNELMVKLKSLTYDEFTKAIKRENFVEGLYEADRLVFPVKLEKYNKMEIIEKMCDETEITRDIKVTLEIYNII